MVVGGDLGWLTLVRALCTVDVVGKLVGLSVAVDGAAAQCGMLL